APAPSLGREDAFVHAAVTVAVTRAVTGNAVYMARVGVVIAAAIDIFVVQVSAQRAVLRGGIEGSAIAVFETHDQVLFAQPTHGEQGDVVAFDLPSFFNVFV